jgi:transcriptional regulator with XRE-family HTH domain
MAPDGGKGQIESGESETRAYIGAQVRALREARELSQEQLGERLHISRDRLAEIELGRGSLSAEQFLHLLKFFNVPASRFDPAPTDISLAIQKAIEAHGASHLVAPPAILPSERLASIDAAIREALIEGEHSRVVAGLAPVLISHIGLINVPKLFVQFRDYHLENRLGWLIDNTIAACEVMLQESPPRAQKRALLGTVNVLRGHRDRFFAGGAAIEPPYEDYLGLPVVSLETKQLILRDRSEISRTWNILTILQVEDFVSAIRQGWRAV